MVYYWDIEVFPNFFSALFISEDFKDEYIFYKFGDVDNILPLVQFVSQEDLTLVGYNSVGYDDIMMKAIIAKPEMTNRQIFNVSKAIVSTNRLSELKPVGLKRIAYEKATWKTADMMNVLKINMNRPSLKFCAVHLKHNRVQDLPKPFDEKVRPDEVEAILDYNRNDVIITGKIWCLPKVKEAIVLREKMGERYDVDLLSADDSKIANVILESEYGKPAITQTRRKVIYGDQLIPRGFEFKTDEMNAVLDNVKDITLHEIKTNKDKFIHLIKRDGKLRKGESRWKQFEIIFDFNGTVFKMAKGGLHSDDQPRVLKNTDSYIYRDCDVGSYYPSLRQEYELVPAHLDKERFLAVDKEIITTRLAAKHSGDKVTADGLKISINGTFGKYNYDGFWLYDPLCMYQTTVYGQLFLLLLIEMLYLKGIQTVSANTDGIVCKIPVELEDVYFETCVEWQKLTKMSLEYTDYAFLAQLNVNSYMSHAIREGVHNDDWSINWYEKDDIKKKKDFLDNLSLNKASFVKGFSAPIIAIALQRYFKDGMTPEETINNENDIHNFMFSPKGSRKFYFVYVHPDGTEIILQKTNRFFITSEVTGVIVKRDKTDYDAYDDEDDSDDTFTNMLFDGVTSKVTRETSIAKGNYTYIMNDIHKNRPAVNKAFYIGKIQEIIDKIEPVEKERISIFDLM